MCLVAVVSVKKLDVFIITETAAEQRCFKKHVLQVFPHPKLSHSGPSYIAPLQYLHTLLTYLFLCVLVGYQVSVVYIFLFIKTSLQSGTQWLSNKHLYNTQSIKTFQDKLFLSKDGGVFLCFFCSSNLGVYTSQVRMLYIQYESSDWRGLNPLSLKEDCWPQVSTSAPRDR